MYHANDPVSVIINVYNEAGTIEQEIRDLQRTIIAELPGSELIVAEDGSQDGTKAIIQRLQKELNFVYSTSAARKGYTQALRDALSLAKQPYIFFSDTGSKFDLQDFWRLYAYRASHDLVMGVRVNRRDQYYRQLLTWGYNYAIRMYFGTTLHDSDSGFRLYSARLVRNLLNQPWVNKNLIGSELALRAAALGYSIKEVPVSYRQRSGTSRGLPLAKMPRVVKQTVRNFPLLKQELERARAEHLKT